MIPVRFARDAVRGTDLSLKARYLLAILVCYANPAKICHPSDAELTDVTGMSRWSLQRARRELIDAGLVDINSGQGRGRRTVYLLLMPDLAPIHNRSRAAPFSPENGAERTHKRCSPAPENGAGLHRGRELRKGAKEGVPRTSCDATCPRCEGSGVEEFTQTVRGMPYVFAQRCPNQPR
jgi:hypothetical protein